MVTERRNFRKYYDLAEKVVPEGVNTTMPEPDELARFHVRKALQAMGVATEKEILRFLQPASARDSEMQFVAPSVLKQSLHQFVSEGWILPVTIDGDIDKTPSFILYDNLHSPDSVSPERQTRVLSPFDNLLIQRDRTKRLFDFDYTIECYVPEPKRQFGYFVLPVLQGEQFIGRLDAKADRKSGEFLVHKLFFEDKAVLNPENLDELAGAVVSFALYNNCRQITLGELPTGGNKTKIQALFRKKMKELIKGKK